MLGKLFKYEWKAISKVGLLMLAALAIATLLGVVGFALPFSSMTETAVSSDEDSLATVLTVLVAIATMMVYIMTMMVVVYGALIYLGIRFYKSMYSDEGYLTHTLPVTPRQLIISKVLASGLWYAIISIAMAISILILVFSMVFFMEGALGFSVGLSEMGKELMELYGTTMGFEVAHVMISLLLVLILSPFSTMMTLFGALTIGQLASKYRAVMGILAYYGICMINSVVSYIISFVVSFSTGVFSSIMDTEPSIAVAYDVSLIVSVLMLVVFYFVTHSILTKKLNME